MLNLPSFVLHIVLWNSHLLGNSISFPLNLAHTGLNSLVHSWGHMDFNLDCEEQGPSLTTDQPIECIKQTIHF